LVSRPDKKKSIGVKWIYKEKKNAKEKVERYKARLVEKCYSQKHEIDYEKVFVHFAKLETIRLIIATVAQHRWRIYQRDVKSTFLNGFLEKEIYIEQHIGYEVKGYEDKVLKLNKSLNGLKQALRAWYSHIDCYFSKKWIC
jgi:DNA polymerase zeta